LGERFNGIEEVVGSIPSGSTNKNNNISEHSDAPDDMLSEKERQAEKFGNGD
jgi:hypothetical protein